ncbi:MAG: YbaK/EbsC family protein [bacterium]|nr:YbaK/EbsC family protein [bacterium]
MSIPKRLLSHLERCDIAHEVLPHRKVFTAFDLAQTLGEELGAVAKSVLVRADRDLVLVSVPADTRIDFDRLKKVTGAKKVSIASEQAIAQLKIKVGTTPPFGTFFGVRCVLDSGLAKCRRIVCRAGSHTESLRCDVQDFIDAEAPVVAKVSERVRRSMKSRSSKSKKPTVAKRSAKKPAKKKPVKRSRAARR